jgi:hypothetical protein
MVGVDEKALRNHFRGADLTPSKLATSLVDAGFNPADFSEQGIPDLAAAIVIEYYAIDAGRRCTGKL